MADLSFDLGHDPTGKRLTKAVTIQGTKTEPQRKLREMLTALDQGRNPVPADISLRVWLERWMSEVVIPNLRQRTQETYRNVIDRHIVPYLGGLGIGKLTPGHIQALEVNLHKRLSAAMVSMVHNVLSGAMMHALRLDLIRRNPVSLATPPTVKSWKVLPPNISAVRELLALAARPRNRVGEPVGV